MHFVEYYGYVYSRVACFLYNCYFKIHLNVYMLYTVHDMKLYCNQNLVRICVWQLTGLGVVF